MLDFYVKTGIRFSLRDKRLFDITEVEITVCDKHTHIQLLYMLLKIIENIIMFGLKRFDLNVLN